MPKNIIRVILIYFIGLILKFDVFMLRALFTGQFNVHSLQFIQSGDLTSDAFATSIFIGHFLVHNPQLTHLFLSLTIFDGLSKDIKDRKAPMGHRYLQKNLSYNIEPPRTLSRVHYSSYNVLD